MGAMETDYEDLALDLAAAIKRNAAHGVKAFSVRGRSYTLESAKDLLATLRELRADQAGVTPGEAVTYAEVRDP